MFSLAHHSNNSWTDAAGMAALYGMCTESSSGIVSVIRHMSFRFKAITAKPDKTVSGRVREPWSALYHLCYRHFSQEMFFIIVDKGAEEEAFLKHT